MKRNKEPEKKYGVKLTSHNILQLRSPTIRRIVLERQGIFSRWGLLIFIAIIATSILSVWGIRYRETIRARALYMPVCESQIDKSPDSSPCIVAYLSQESVKKIQLCQKVQLDFKGFPSLTNIRNEGIVQNIISQYPTDDYKAIISISRPIPANSVTKISMEEVIQGEIIIGLKERRLLDQIINEITSKKSVY